MMDWMEPWMALPIAGAVYWLLWWLENKSKTKIGSRIRESTYYAWQMEVEKRERELKELLQHGQDKGFRASGS